MESMEKSGDVQSMSFGSAYWEREMGEGKFASKSLKERSGDAIFRFLLLQLIVQFALKVVSLQVLLIMVKILCCDGSTLEEKGRR
jgi:hypothetical protein